MRTFILPIPGLEACLIGVFLGFCIPALSSIIPILNAMSKTLGDSLNVQQSKTSGIIITVDDGK